MTNWKEYKFSDFVNINPKVALKKGAEYSFVEMKDLSEGSKFVTPSQKRELKGGSRFENGDTLFARITPCLENGKISQVKELENGVGFGSTEFLVFRGKQGVSNTDFVHYLALSDEVRSFAEQNMVGTSGRQRVSWQAFENLELSLPDLPTQTAIAEILSSLDDKIELNNKINQELENLAQTLFKQWFIDFEFPNENGEPYKSSGGEMVDSELGEIPKEWEVKSLDEIANITIGRTPPRKEHQWFSVNSNDVKWISIKDMGNCDTYIMNTSEYLTEAAVTKFNVPIIQKNTVIISFKLTVGRISITTERMLSNEAIAHLNLFDENINPEFIYLYLKQFDFDSLGSTSSIATAVNSKAIKALHFIYPATNILDSFQEQVSYFFEQILNTTRENQELINLRDTLLPKLISGELEVADIMAEKA